jgi:hypothetical protein
MGQLDLSQPEQESLLWLACSENPLKTTPQKPNNGAVWLSQNKCSEYIRNSSGLELHPDVWQRIERAADVVAKSPPQHRVGKKSAKKPRDSKPKGLSRTRQSVK